MRPNCSPLVVLSWHQPRRAFRGGRVWCGLAWNSSAGWCGIQWMLAPAPWVGTPVRTVPFLGVGVAAWAVFLVIGRTVLHTHNCPRKGRKWDSFIGPEASGAVPPLSSPSSSRSIQQMQTGEDEDRQEGRLRHNKDDSLAADVEDRAKARLHDHRRNCNQQGPAGQVAPEIPGDCGDEANGIDGRESKERQHEARHQRRAGATGVLRPTPGADGEGET